MRGNFDYTSNQTVMDVIGQAARRINRQYERYSETDDLIQEAHVFVSTKADLQEAIEREEWGLLQHRLEADLRNYLDAEVRRTKRNISYNARQESLGEAKAVATRRFSDLGESGFRGGSEPVEHEVTVTKVGA